MDAAVPSDLYIKQNKKEERYRLLCLVLLFLKGRSAGLLPACMKRKLIAVSFAMVLSYGKIVSCQCLECKHFEDRILTKCERQAFK